MKKMTLTDRVCVLCVLTLSSAILISSTATQEPALACVGELITVTCDLSVPSPDDSFIALRTNFLVGTSIALPVGTVNGNTMQGGVDLSRLTADAPVGTANNVQGTLTLMSYTLADDGLVLGCTIEHNINGNNNNLGSLVETVNLTQAVPPSPPVSLTAGYNSPTCSGTVQLAWTPGASDRDIEMYFLYLNGTLIASLGPSERNVTHILNLDENTEYNYSVVAMSCADNSTHTYADTISIGNPPSSPVVTLSQSDNSCSNIQVSWSTPSSDRSVTSYSVYRNNTLIYNGPDNPYTDNTQLNINTEYSVVAISCAGNSTGVNTVSIGGTSLSDSSLTISYDNTTNELFVDWTLNPSQPISVTYNLSLVYSYTHNNETYFYNETDIFSQESTDTNNTQSLIRPTFLSTNESVEFVITATLRITQQCNTTITDGTILNAIITTAFTLPPPLPVESIIGIVAAAVGGSLFCISALSLTGVTIGIIVYVSKKKDTKRRSNTQELEPKRMEGLYAHIDHTLPNPDTIKRPEPIEETLYTKVHAMDGPNH